MHLNFKRWKIFIKSFFIVSSCVIIFDRIPYLNQYAQQLEQLTLDLRYRNFNRNNEPSQRVVLVDLDEESLKKYAEAYGRWPWPRRAHKEIISFIGEGNPSMILFDVLFTEPQKDSEDDKLLAEVSAQYKNVSHAALLLPQSEIEGVDFIPLPKDRAIPTPVVWTKIPEAWFGDQKHHSIALPNTDIWQKTSFIHSVNADPDSDGILRRLPMVLHYDGQWIPSLTLQGILSQSLGAPTKINFQNDHLEIYEGNQQLKYRIPLDKNGNIPVHYYQKSKQLTHIRVGEILDSAKAKESGDVEGIKIDPEIFKDKVVIIGTSAMGLADLKVTPIGTQYPGVLLHATAISNVLNNDYLFSAPPNTTLWISLFLIFISYFSIFFFENFFIRNFLPPLCLFGGALFSILTFRDMSLHLPMALPLIAGSLSVLHGYLHLGIIEARQRKMMQGTLSKYLSPTVTKHLIDSGANPTAEVGKWKEVSILFSDIRGFTSLSEEISPDFLVRVLNEYLGEMTDIIFEHDGTLDKFIGDAVMAFWGAPLDDHLHATKAVSTALHMIRTVDAFNERNRKNGYPKLKLGIGIHTGKAIVGNIGSNKRLDYTIIGDSVNLASRLEGLTKEYGVPFLVSNTTYEAVKDFFIFRPLDIVVAKGKTQSVSIFQPLAERKPNPEVAKWEYLSFQFNEAFKLYQQGHFTWALENFNKIKDKFPEDGPTLTYIERCQALIESPPTEWKGVFIAKSK